MDGVNDMTLENKCQYAKNYLLNLKGSSLYLCEKKGHCEKQQGFGQKLFCAYYLKPYQYEEKKK